MKPTFISGQGLSAPKFNVFCNLQIVNQSQAISEFVDTPVVILFSIYQNLFVWCVLELYIIVYKIRNKEGFINNFMLIMINS